MPALILAAVLAVQSAGDVRAPTGRFAASTRQLAAELLPREWAADAVSHVVSMPIVHDGPPFSITFDGRARGSNDGFCARKVYHVSNLREAGGRIEPGGRGVTDKIRLGNCDGHFAHVNPGADTAKQLLRWMAGAVRIAQSRRPLPIATSCVDEVADDIDRCARGARAVLAALSLDKATMINRPFSSPPHHWNLAVAETYPVSQYWDVTVDATPGKASIALAWRIPAPF